VPRLLPSHALALLLLLAAASFGGCTTNGGATAQTAERPPRLDVENLERRVHDLVNRARRARGLDPVGWRDDLRDLGAVHSRDMAENAFFAHRNLANEQVNERAARLGVTCVRPLRADGSRVTGLAENLSRSTRYVRYRDVYVGDEVVQREYDWRSADAIAQATVQGWLDSPPHRRNLLDGTLDNEGIGIAMTDEYVFVTQVMC
jgi:uncharacterized protein YkwD